MSTREQQLQEIVGSLIQWANEAPATRTRTDFEKNLTDLLRSDEGQVLNAYQDHLGFWTIGIGRLIDARKGGGISKEEAEYLLANDIAKVMAGLATRLPWFATLDAARQGVLCAMAFQMGIDGLLGFVNTLKMVEAGDYPGAARGMLNSKWASQTPGRAKRMAEQMKNGVWQIP